MARALPFHVRQLFALLARLGWSQTRCAQVLGLSQQTVNNWACGLSVPARHRGPLISLATLTLHDALDAVHEDPAALAQRTKTMDHFLSAWFFENQDARGLADRWHTDLGKRLLLHFKQPLALQGVEAWKAELALHLEAANQLRYLIQRHELRADLPEPNFRQHPEGPPEWLWEIARQLHGAPLEKSAALQAYEAREFATWVASLPAEQRAGLEAMRAAAPPKQD